MSDWGRPSSVNMLIRCGAALAGLYTVGGMALAIYACCFATTASGRAQLGKGLLLTVLGLIGFVLPGLLVRRKTMAIPVGWLVSISYTAIGVLGFIKTVMPQLGRKTMDFTLPGIAAICLLAGICMLVSMGHGDTRAFIRQARKKSSHLGRPVPK